MSVKKHPNPNEGDIVILTEGEVQYTRIQVTENMQVVIETREQGSVRNSGGTDCSEVVVYFQRPMGHDEFTGAMWVNDEVLKPDTFKRILSRGRMKVVDFEYYKRKNAIPKEGIL